MEKMVHLAFLESLEKWVLEGFQAPEDSMDFLVLLEFQDLRELQDLRAMKVQLGPLDHQGKLVTKVLWVHQVLWDLWDLLDKLDQGANQDYQDYQGLMGCLAKMENLANLGLKETKDLKGILDLLDFLDLEELKEILEKEDNKERRERKEKLVLRVRRETWEARETGEFLVLLENRVQRDLRVLKAQKDPLENLVLLAHLERRGRMAPLVLLDILEGLETRVIKEPKDVMAHPV